MKVILIGVFLLGLIGAPFAWQIAICQIHEHDYGINTKWTLLSGCMIEVGDGVFVPEERYRGMAE